jgi:hypothetical protein
MKTCEHLIRLTLKQFSIAEWILRAVLDGEGVRDRPGVE